MRNRLNRIEEGRISQNPMRTLKVAVTRRGQTTIPAEFRKRYGIEEGSMLEIEDTGRGLLLKKAKSTTDLIGTGKRPQREIFDALDKMREEDD
jgi:AbrB family looped-hinge helix DNA binding protein